MPRRMQSVFSIEPYNGRVLKTPGGLIQLWAFAHDWGISSNQRVALQDPLQEII
jgi:hypothetical protein